MSVCFFRGWRKKHERELTPEGGKVNTVMKIINTQVIADTQNTRLVKLTIHAPLIASRGRPGQFVILMVNEHGERIPLTLVDTDPKNQTITIIVQELGYTSRLLAAMRAGDSLYSLVGPLGHATPSRKYGKILMVGGGVGIAELYPVIRLLKTAGNTIYSILGARTKDLLILKDEVEKFSDKLFIATDDGTFGEKGFVSNILERLLKEDKDFQVAYCVGPVPMMKVVANVTRPYNIKTWVSLNAIMLDGTGMCGCCRLTEGGKTRFCCVDGPDFDAHQVDFDELASRQKRFLDEEKIKNHE
jgi:ferredoxin--NADP+ reductase